MVASVIAYEVAEEASEVDSEVGFKLDQFKLLAHYCQSSRSQDHITNLNLL